MAWAQMADVLQIMQAAGVLILVIKALGSWQQRTESAPAELGRQLKACREACDARLKAIDVEADRIRRQLDHDYPRKDTLDAKLDGIYTRLGTIERAVLQQPPMEA
jgi:hypothetical protein